MTIDYALQFRHFLTAAGWPDARLDALPGDASFRRYFRVDNKGKSAMLMHAPPPHEDPTPFIAMARYLRDNDLRAPEIFYEETQNGLVLLENFGELLMREAANNANQEEEAALYRAAIDNLLLLAQKPLANIAAYNMDEYLREARLFVEYYCPARELDVDLAGYDAAWRQALAPLLAENAPKVTVLRDYHAENIMLLNDGSQGLLDFQDALIGDPAYDLVSLLQDARRDVSVDLRSEMLRYYCDRADKLPDDFMAHYALTGAQRNAKIVGIFVRLWKRDGKPRYLNLIPRVWRAMERDLEHPALAPVAKWFADNIPVSLRTAHGGGFADMGYNEEA